MSSSFIKDCFDSSEEQHQAAPEPLPPAPAQGNKTVFIIVNNDAQIDHNQLSNILGVYLVITVNLWYYHSFFY